MSEVVSEGLKFFVGGTLALVGKWLLEKRRRIFISTPQFYFGPLRVYNGFLDATYPSHDHLDFDCVVRLFSHKTVETVLHGFKLEFCRSTYLRPVIEFQPDMNRVFKDGSHYLDAVELPTRKLVSFSLRVQFHREDWSKLENCSSVYLSCVTAEGKAMRFKLASFEIPKLQPKKPRYTDFMKTSMSPGPPSSSSGVVIVAKQNLSNSIFPSIDLGSRDSHQLRFWDGEKWTPSMEEAKVYPHEKAAKEAGKELKIWERVPSDWLLAIDTSRVF